MDVLKLSNGTYILKACLFKDGKEVFRKVQPIVVLR